MLRTRFNSEPNRNTACSPHLEQEFFRDHVHAGPTVPFYLQPSTPNRPAQFFCSRVVNCEGVVTEGELSRILGFIEEFKPVHNVFRAAKTVPPSKHSNSRAELAPVDTASARRQVKHVFIPSKNIKRPQVSSWKWKFIEVFDVWSIRVPHDFRAFPARRSYDIEVALSFLNPLHQLQQGVFPL